MEQPPGHTPDLTAVAPDLRPFLAAFPDLPLKKAADLPEARAFLDELTAPASSGAGCAAAPPGGVERFELYVPGPAGAPDVRLLVHRPVAAALAAKSSPLLLHLHGGGMIMGVPEMDNPRLGALAAKYG